MNIPKHPEISSDAASHIKDNFLLRGADIRAFAPSEEDSAFIKRLAGMPTLRIHTDSHEWLECRADYATLTLGAHKTPLSPLLTIEFRVGHCWLYVFADYGDPELWTLLDSWAESRCALVEVVIGLDVYRELLPVGDLRSFAKYRSQLDVADRSAFVEAVERFLANCAPERHVLSKTENETQHQVVEVNLLATTRVVESVTRMSIFSVIPKIFSCPTVQDCRGNVYPDVAAPLH